MPAIKSDGTVLQTKEAQAFGQGLGDGASGTILIFPGLYLGFGAPASGLGANNDYYLRSDGSTNTRVYHKESGSWVGLI
jgi:hypothetical protein